MISLYLFEDVVRGSYLYVLCIYFLFFLSVWCVSLIGFPCVRAVYLTCGFYTALSSGLAGGGADLSWIDLKINMF